MKGAGGAAYRRPSRRGKDKEGKEGKKRRKKGEKEKKEGSHALRKNAGGPGGVVAFVSRWVRSGGFMDWKGAA